MNIPTPGFGLAQRHLHANCRSFASLRMTGTHRLGAGAFFVLGGKEGVEDFPDGIAGDAGALLAMVTRMPRRPAFSTHGW